MRCVCHTKLSVKLQTNARIDPTRTVMIRRKFEAEVNRRFAWLKRQIRRVVVDEDGFGLEQPRFFTQARQFDLPRTTDKVDSFMDWLKRSERQGILGIQEGTPVRSGAPRAWSSTYIRAGYQKGVQHAGGALRKAGVEVKDRWIDGAFNRPVHADRAALVYTRTYTELEGITNAMDRQISRTLAEGIVQGKSPLDIAKDIVGRVDAIGLARARTLARTEVISAHHEATITSYREAGVDGVEVVAEFMTAGDNLVCEECESLEGKTFSLDEAEGLIPVHPNCRCTTIPKVLRVDGISLE